MRLENYLIEAKTTYFTKQESITFVTQKCIDAFKSSYKRKIFRGIRGINDDFLFVDPTTDERRSANTSNYYTLLLDKFSSWKMYPKRSRSLICSTDPGYADAFGTLFVVLPMDNMKIGICSGDDLWTSFDAINSLEDFNDEFEHLLNYIMKSYQGDIRYDSDINMLLKRMKDIDKNKDNVYRIFLDSKSKYILEYFTNHVPYFNTDKTLYDVLEGVFNPVTNGFKLIKSNNIESIPSNREVWTDSPSLLIRSTIYEDFQITIEDLNKKS